MFDNAANLARVTSAMAKFRLQICFEAFAYEVVSKEQVVYEGTAEECIDNAEPWTADDIQRAVQSQWKEGVLSKNVLYRAVEWKAGRQRKSLFNFNSSSQVKSCTEPFIRAVNLAVSSGPNWQSVGDAIHCLSGCPNTEHARCQYRGEHPWKLRYVGVPIATALLRFAYPDIFGILDKNALKALRKAGITSSGFSDKVTQYPPSRVPSYFRLLAHIGNATVPRMAPWQVDNALYVAGGGKGSRCPNPCPQRGAGFCTR